jgi:hypothetical protein
MMDSNKYAATLALWWLKKKSEAFPATARDFGHPEIHWRPREKAAVDSPGSHAT